MSPPGGGALRRGQPHDALVAFRRYLAEIEQAVLQRDAMRITALLRKRTATHLPREVREELLLVSRAPRDSLRAPVRFLRFQHRMAQLAAGGERLPTAQTELRLESRVDMHSIRLRDVNGRRSAACDGDAEDAPPIHLEPSDDENE